MNKSILLLVITALLTFNSYAGFAAEPVHVPTTARPAVTSNLIGRSNRALREYVAACSMRDNEAVERVFTRDAVVEYALEEPGTYLVVDSVSLSGHRLGNARRTGASAHISNVWIFPTNDSNTVFAQYKTTPDSQSSADLAGTDHLALIEMRGDRIMRMRKLSSEDDHVSTTEAQGATRAVPSLCTGMTQQKTTQTLGAAP